MAPRNFLLVSTDPALLQDLPTALVDQPGSLQVDAVSRVDDALKQLKERPYEGAICVVDSPDELACIIRLKKRQPDLQVVMLTQSDEPTLHRVGQQMGADEVVNRGSSIGKTAELLVTALESRTVAAGVHRTAAETAELVRDIRLLNERNRELLQKAMGLAASVQTGEFVTLVVEDEPSDLLLMVKALRKAGLPPFVRTTRSVPQAIDYLSGRGEYVDRLEHPTPSLIISDLNLGEDRGVDLLRWVRSQPHLAHLGFILFTSSESERDMAEATDLNVNFYIVKTLKPDKLVEVVRSVYEHAKRYKTL